MLAYIVGYFLSGIHMTPQERERMNSLCIRIQEERNPRQFEVLLQQLNEVIRQKERRFPQYDGGMAKLERRRPWKAASGTVEKVLKSPYPNKSDTVQIAVTEADHLFREIRIENTFTDIDGQPVALKHGAHVDVIFEADAKDTVRQEPAGH